MGFFSFNFRCLLREVLQFNRRDRKCVLKINIKCSKSDSNAFCFCKQIKIMLFLLVPLLFCLQSNLEENGCLFILLIQG